MPKTRPSAMTPARIRWKMYLNFIFPTMTVNPITSPRKMALELLPASSRRKTMTIGAPT